jgi:alpha,alpha-trehalose-phosphate synthase [UDP-forming]
VSRFVIVSNRLPVVLTHVKSSWTVTSGTGGLVSALAPVLRNRGGVWIGWPGTHLVEDEEMARLVEEATDRSGYEFVPVFLSKQEVERYYHGFSNQVLWPFLHDYVNNCNFAPEYWYEYLDVNRKFADVVLERTSSEDFVWVHDYHLIHVAQYIRERDPKRRIGFFLHVPFPPLDILIKLPWRGPILRALQSYDLLGFQTLRDRRNFIRSIHDLLPDVRVSGKRSVMRLDVSGRSMLVGVFPIGIDHSSFTSVAASPDVEKRVDRLREDIGPHRIVLGVDRLDYTKGVPERLRAFRTMLRKYPEHRGKVVLVQILVPSRENLPLYRELKSTVDGLVGEINGEFATIGWSPVIYRYAHLSRHDLVALYRIADVGLVTPYKDGMNLVAKEYCACQVREKGVLVLSEFAGAAAQLQRGAILVNPYDIEGTADALHNAFSLDDTVKRMRSMRTNIRRQNVFWWVDNYLRAAFGRELKDFPAQEEYFPQITTTR